MSSQAARLTSGQSRLRDSLPKDRKPNGPKRKNWTLCALALIAARQGSGHFHVQLVICRWLGSMCTRVYCGASGSGHLLRHAWHLPPRSVRALWARLCGRRVRVLASRAAPGQGAGCDATYAGATCDATYAGAAPGQGAGCDAAYAGGKGRRCIQARPVAVSWRQPASCAVLRGALTAGLGSGTADVGQVLCWTWLAAYSGAWQLGRGCHAPSWAGLYCSVRSHAFSYRRGPDDGRPRK